IDGCPVARFVRPRATTQCRTQQEEARPHKGHSPRLSPPEKDDRHVFVLSLKYLEDLQKTQIEAVRFPKSAPHRNVAAVGGEQLHGLRRKPGHSDIALPIARLILLPDAIDPRLATRDERAADAEIEVRLELITGESLELPACGLRQTRGRRAEVVILAIEGHVADEVDRDLGRDPLNEAALEHELPTVLAQVQGA
ncbi:hypothetical protein KXX12_008360, partial [Aspergillus fumigatus]